MIETRTIDEEVDELVDRHGIHTVLAALCRSANNRGLTTLFRKLNRVYDWLTM